jgi:hypothetical protein
LVGAVEQVRPPAALLVLAMVSLAGIGGVQERSVADAFGVGARLPCLDRERRAVPDVAHVDAAAGEFV